MGRKKKVFIDKKNSATFKLLARDTSTFPEAGVASVPPASDSVFVRVDNNLFHMPSGFENADDDDNYAGTKPDNLNGEDCDSIFADAPDDNDEQLSFSKLWPNPNVRSSRDRASSFLPEETRKEILELGLPDDGCNYLQHLREISNAGAGSAYYQNSKTRLDLVPLDVKAYDASRLKVTGDESKKTSIYAVASKTVSVKVQKVFDPDVARLLEDSDLSRFGSDTEDFEEDFVFKANLPEGNEEEIEEMGEAEPESVTEKRSTWLINAEEDESLDKDAEDELDDASRPRINRFLDEQFDLLTLREYNDDTYYADDGCLEMESGMLATKLHDTLNGGKLNLEVEDQYRVPGDYLHKQEALSKESQLGDSMDVIRKCREYAEKFCNENEDNEELIMVEESSDESEIWDCETIVSTYSNLDNHPGKIQAPKNQIRKSAKKLQVDSIKKIDMIELRGKEKLPFEFLPHGKKDIEKVKKVADSEKQISKSRKEESKDEKKERKVAVKEERREARRSKKELKGLYRSETYRAQKCNGVRAPAQMAREAAKAASSATWVDSGEAKDVQLQHEHDIGKICLKRV